MRKLSTRKIVLVGLISAISIALSTISIPVGPTKVFPFQHMMNVVAGVLLGPWYASLAALITAVSRIMLGTGSIFAIPGSIPGAFVVGYAYRYLHKDYAGLFEPLGTGPIGATLSALVVAPFLGKSLTVMWFQAAFLSSSIPGSILGVILLRILRKTKMLERWNFNYF